MLLLFNFAKWIFTAVVLLRTCHSPLKASSIRAKTTDWYVTRRPRNRYHLLSEACCIGSKVIAMATRSAYYKHDGVTFLTVCNTLRVLTAVSAKKDR